MTVSITAGGRVAGAFADVIQTPIKALAPFGARRLIDTALDAAAACSPTRIVVVGDEMVRAHCSRRVDDVLPAAAEGQENLARALRAGAPDEALLLLTSDLPFISAPALRDFVNGSGDADVAMPVCTHASYAEAFPGAPDHATALAGERIVNASVFYFAPGAALRALAVAQRLFGARKSLVAMALLLDAPLLLRFVTRRLRVSDLEAFGTRKFGLRTRAVGNASPDLCYDVDTLEDYHYALAHIATH